MNNKVWLSVIKCAGPLVRIESNRIESNSPVCRRVQLDGMETILVPGCRYVVLWSGDCIDILFFKLLQIYILNCFFLVYGWVYLKEFELHLRNNFIPNICFIFMFITNLRLCIISLNFLYKSHPAFSCAHLCCTTAECIVTHNQPPQQTEQVCIYTI